MRRYFSLLAVLAVGSVVAVNQWLVSSGQVITEPTVAEQPAAEPAPIDQRSALTETLQQLPPAFTSPPEQSAALPIDPFVNNPAANFDQLPQPLQQEIRQLSGRDASDAEPVEIQPGVFAMPSERRPQVVPVAVMNADGTVSIYEY